MNRPNIVGIIPARGGSKAIPLKNIKPLNGTPLISFTIETALKSKCLEGLYVSTDNSKVADISKGFGVEVIPRPDNLALDTSSTEEALLHAVEWIKRKGNPPEVVITLEPTSPFRSLETLEACCRVFQNPEYDSVVGVIENKKRIGTLEEGKFRFLFPEERYLPRRQDRKPTFMECGTIWGTRVEVLQKYKSVFGDHVYPLVIPEYELMDINTPDDFAKAEEILKSKLRESKI